jgi:hypothetical protein
MLKEFLSGGGEASSKRLCLFIFVWLYVVYFFSNLYFKCELKQTIEDTLFYLILASFTGVGLEKWPINLATLFGKKETLKP